MSGARQPAALAEAKKASGTGKHWTKAELEKKKNGEVTVHADKVKAPPYLSDDLKKRFRKIAKELMEVKLITNLDVDALARYLIAEQQYIKVSQEIARTDLMVTRERIIKDSEGNEIDRESWEEVNCEMERLLLIQDRCFKQCRQGAADFGLTITSRCKLVVPKKEEQKNNKFAKFIKTGNT